MHVLFWAVSLGARLCAPRAVLQPSLFICHPCFMSVLPKGGLELRNERDGPPLQAGGQVHASPEGPQFGFADFFTPCAALQNALS